MHIGNRLLCDKAPVTSVIKLQLCVIKLQRQVNFDIDLPSLCKKVQVGKDQEKAQSEKDSHSKNRGGKKQQTNNQVLIP